MGATLAALVWLGWPRPADSDVLQAYTRLDRSPVPVKLLGWIDPRDVRAEVSGDGYVVQLRERELGELTISGCRPCAGDAPAGSLTWTDGGIRYALQTTADPTLVVPRLVPLSVARQQLEGNGWDIPVLYLVYLPAFTAFAGWALWTMLARPDAR